MRQWQVAGWSANQCPALMCSHGVFFSYGFGKENRSWHVKPIQSVIYRSYGTVLISITYTVGSHNKKLLTMKIGSRNPLKWWDNGRFYYRLHRAFLRNPWVKPKISVLTYRLTVAFVACSCFCPRLHESASAAQAQRGVRKGWDVSE